MHAENIGIYENISHSVSAVIYNYTFIRQYLCTSIYIYNMLIITKHV